MLQKRHGDDEERDSSDSDTLVKEPQSYEEDESDGQYQRYERDQCHRAVADTKQLERCREDDGVGGRCIENTVGLFRRQRNAQGLHGEASQPSPQ